MLIGSRVCFCWRKRREELSRRMKCHLPWMRGSISRNNLILITVLAKTVQGDCISSSSWRAILRLPPSDDSFGRRERSTCNQHNFHCGIHCYTHVNAHLSSSRDCKPSSHWKEILRVLSWLRMSPIVFGGLTQLLFELLFILSILQTYVFLFANCLFGFNNGVFNCLPQQCKQRISMTNQSKCLLLQRAAITSWFRIF